MKSFTKFEVDTTFRCPSVIAADTFRDVVTFIFDLLTLVSGHVWQVIRSIPPLSLKIPRLCVLELRILTLMYAGNIQHEHLTDHVRVTGHAI